MTDLYRLLPAIHRLRDAQRGRPLEALLGVLQAEIDATIAATDQLHDDWFIETCEEWVVPYIADLLGIASLPQVAPGAGFSQRGYVANTLAYRRRKGTAAVLEQLATDLTGWRARAVEFIRHTAACAHAQHPRGAQAVCPDLRSATRHALHDSPFDDVPHLADARHIDNGRGRHNLPHVGLFLWPLTSYLLRDVTPRALDATRFTADPLGRSTPLFVHPQGEATLADETAPRDVPMPLTRLALHADRASYLGDAAAPRSLVVMVDGAPQPQDMLRICNLSDAGAGWAHAAAPGTIAVDPELGRLAFGTAPGDGVAVTCAYGFPGDLGGGPYDRRESVAAFLADGVDWQMGVLRSPPAAEPRIVPTLEAAVTEWNRQPPGTRGVICLMENRSAAVDCTGATRRIRIPEGSHLLIVAADWPATPTDAGDARAPGRLAPTGRRPHLTGTLQIDGTAPAGTASPGSLHLDGLLLEATVTVLPGFLGALRLAHCTLVPGASALAVGENPLLAIELVRSVSGALDVRDAGTLALRDTIADGAVSARALTLDAVTVLGPVRAETLEASNSLLMERVRVARRQTGCVRYSYVAPGSETPRRHRCQPASAADAARVRPRFASTRHGDATYLLLARGTAPELAGGADDEGEPGAWHFLHSPLRVRQLRLALEEYLRFGLEAGVLLVTPDP